MAAPCIHHVGIGVTDETLTLILTLFQRKLGFELTSTRETYFDTKWVLKHNKLIFVITKLKVDGYRCQNNDQFEFETQTESKRKIKSERPWETKSQIQGDVPNFESFRSTRNVSKDVETSSIEVVLSNKVPSVQEQSESLTPKDKVCCNTYTPTTVSQTFTQIQPSFGTSASNSFITNCFNCNTSAVDYGVQGEGSSQRCEFSDMPDFSSYWQSSSCQDEDQLTASLFSDKHYCHEHNLIKSNSSVYEVCLEVRDVAATLERAQSFGALIIKPLTVVKDCNGMVTYAVIRSCVGNVQHTILNTDQYHGRFLPGFEDQTVITADPIQPVVYDRFDHITLCVHPGQTMETISWYENCFGMHRLMVNKDEDIAEGLMLYEIGMRMAAMEYWNCSESGLSLDVCKMSAKFVIVESPSTSPNQVTTFLCRHGGPGIQHIGLLTNKLIDTIKHLKVEGVPFLQPPTEYYEEISKLNEILECGESVDLLKTCGILLDSEADCIEETGEKPQEPMSRYLMQIFTKSIFGDGTFFLEFLQRHGAQGFGAGNITALWKAVRLYMERKPAAIHGKEAS